MENAILSITIGIVVAVNCVLLRGLRNVSKYQDKIVQLEAENKRLKYLLRLCGVDTEKEEKEKATN
jgi:hypothetical protein